MGILHTPQAPAKTGGTTPFSDIFAARTQEPTHETGVATEEPTGFMPGLQPMAPVQPTVGAGGFLPLATSAAGNGLMAGGAQAAPTVAPVVVDDSAAPVVLPAAALSGRGSPATPTADLASPLAPFETVADSPDGVPLPPLMQADRKLAAPIASPLDGPMPAAKPGAPVTGAAVEDSAVAEAFDVNTFADTLAEEADLKTVSPRAVSGTETAIMAPVAPRAVSVAPSEARQSGSRLATASVSPAAAVAPEAAVEDAVVTVPETFDAVVEEAIAPAPLRQQTGASAATVTPDLQLAVNATLDTTTRTTAAVDDVQALDQLDGMTETAELSIDTPVDDANWSEALSYRLQWLAQKEGVQSARIQLNPVELGPLEVNIDVVDDIASIQIRADHGVTRDALEQAAPRLRDMMTGAGFERADLDVSGGDAGERQTAEKRSAEDSRGDTASNANLTLNGQESDGPGANQSDGPRSIPGSDPSAGGSLNLYV